MRHAALAAVAGWLLLAGPALADPPPPGSINAFAGVVICDERAQIVALYEAGAAGGQEAFGTRFMEYATAMNERGEPLCAPGRVPPVKLGERTYLGVLAFNGRDVGTWVLEIIDANGRRLWVMYEEPQGASAPAPKPMVVPMPGAEFWRWQYLRRA